MIRHYVTMAQFLNLQNLAKDAGYFGYDYTNNPVLRFVSIKQYIRDKFNGNLLDNAPTGICIEFMSEQDLTWFILHLEHNYGIKN